MRAAPVLAVADRLGRLHDLLDRRLVTSLALVDPATGNLQFTVRPGTFGSATFSVVLRDSGGTASGGDDTSGVQTFTITIGDLERFLADPHHEAGAEGYVDGPWGARRLVEAATFNLMVDSEHAHSKKTLYALHFTDASGARFRLEGEKSMFDDPGYDSYGDATTLFVTVRRGWDPTGAIEAQGVMRIGGADLLRQVASFRAHHAPSWEAGMTALGRFGAFFFGNLWEPFLSSRIGAES